MLVDKKAVLRALETMAPPFYYLDFESVSPLDPPFAGLAPWETVVTQYSLHVCPEVGAPLQHMEYLAVPDRDCREALASKLISDLGVRGSIIVYSSYEKTQLKAVAEVLPHKATQVHSSTSVLCTTTGKVSCRTTLKLCVGTN